MAVVATTFAEPKVCVEVKDRERIRTVVAFDPGIENMAIWKGYVDNKGDLHTDNWVKLDITDYSTYKHAKESMDYVKREGGCVDPKMNENVECNCFRGKGVYAEIANVLSIHEWIYDAVDVAIIETQDPNNIPTRIIAAAIYGFLRAKFVDACEKVQFSGSRSKTNVKVYIARVLGEPFDPEECRGTSTSPSAYHKTKMTSHYLCNRWIMERGDTFEKELMNKYRFKTGKMKGNDLAEAYLLGAAELLKGVMVEEQMKFVCDEEDKMNSHARGTMQAHRGRSAARGKRAPRGRRIYAKHANADDDDREHDVVPCKKPKIVKKRVDISSCMKPDMVSMILATKARSKQLAEETNVDCNVMHALGITSRVKDIQDTDDSETEETVRKYFKEVGCKRKRDAHDERMMVAQLV
ncbi:MAG: hypothetical protein PHN45_00175 [Methylococcales bacterium]|nr:hypothetical protein [Methylococcales bacterium]